MIIKQASIKDVTKLYNLEQELFNAQNFPLSKGSLRYHILNNLLYTAEVDGEVAGYILVLIKRAKAKLYSIGVNENFRGKKISQMLIDTILRELKILNFKQVLLEVRTDNVVAITLYKKVGFEIKKTLKEFYLDGCDAHLMELDYATKNINCRSR